MDTDIFIRVIGMNHVNKYEFTNNKNEVLYYYVDSKFDYHAYLTCEKFLKEKFDSNFSLDYDDIVRKLEQKQTHFKVEFYYLDMGVVDLKNVVDINIGYDFIKRKYVFEYEGVSKIVDYVSIYDKLKGVGIKKLKMICDSFITKIKIVKGLYVNIGQQPDIYEKIVWFNEKYVVGMKTNINMKKIENIL